MTFELKFRQDICYQEIRERGFSLCALLEKAGIPASEYARGPIDMSEEIYKA